MALLALLVSCLLASAIKADNFYWYKNSVVYQIYVRSFQDTNGDGIGDLKGVIQHADYLQSLGIGAIWLNPIYPTPNYDFGYDISDMENVNPEYGTLDDFNELVKAMKARGIRVIMDFVPNHTSTKHKWFLASEAKNDTVEKYSDFYIWQDPKGYDSNNKPIPPNNWLSVMGTGTAWEWSEKRKQFYLHSFLVEQADLNYANPVVREKMNDVLKQWLSRGVSGFRMDAISWIYDNVGCGNEPASDNPNPDNPNDYNNLKHTCTMDQPETYDIIKEFRKTLDTYGEKPKEAKLMMTESYSDFDTVVKYYGDTNAPGSTFPFNFNFITNVNEGSNTSDWANIMNQWVNLIKEDKWPNWVLGNHDQHRPASRFNDEWVDVLHMMVMSLPGTVLTYNGDEFGLEDAYVRYDEGRDLQGLRAGPSGFASMSRDFQRGPIPWNATRYGGFTTGKPWLPLAPSLWTRNVENESSKNNERSHLNVYKTLVQLRKQQTMSEGSCEVQTTNEGLILITRFLQNNPTTLTVLNIGDFELSVDLTKYRQGLKSTLKVVVSSYNTAAAESLPATSVNLPPKSGVVLSY
ncbi:maltase 1 [Halyomorpha halys]|uniref:maltase 1 n=1 Tax=Halyomorpha halys TaxID=286706 RepID=UPI0006D5213C|nr:maltase 1-like isoform X1 [Halyomorpha halys]XP_014282432.1 maltase 1-like isoform X1 [Halyomorpha halys]